MFPHGNVTAHVKLGIRFKSEEHISVAEQNSEKLYKAEYVGSGTFVISKPKRSKMKRRQSNLKNRRRGSRK